MSDQRLPYTSAILVCEICDRPTMHMFAHGRRMRHRDGTLVAIETIYRCTECKRERRWGLEHSANTQPRVPVILGEAA